MAEDRLYLTSKINISVELSSGLGRVIEDGSKISQVVYLVSGVWDALS
jgi:hypothetical protein